MLLTLSWCRQGKARHSDRIKCCLGFLAAGHNGWLYPPVWLNCTGTSCWDWHLWSSQWSPRIQGRRGTTWQPVGKDSATSGWCLYKTNNIARGSNITFTSHSYHCVIQGWMLPLLFNDGAVAQFIKWNKTLGLHSIAFGKTEDFLMRRCKGVPDTEQISGTENRRLSQDRRLLSSLASLFLCQYFRLLSRCRESPGLICSRIHQTSPLHRPGVKQC